MIEQMFLGMMIRVGAGKPQGKGYFKNGRFPSLRREASRGNMYMIQASNLLEKSAKRAEIKIDGEDKRDPNEEIAWIFQGMLIKFIEDQPVRLANVEEAEKLL